MFMLARILKDGVYWLMLLAFIVWALGLVLLLGGESQGVWAMIGGAVVLGCGMIALFTLHGGDPDGKPDTGPPVYLGEDGMFHLVPAPEPLPERMTKATYAEYLRSSHWKVTRARKLEEVGRRCQLCGQTHHIEIHHNTYQHLGHESMNDLIALCSGCHRHFHQGRKVR